MIQNKSREELIELVYSLEASNQDITACAEIQHSIITEISDTFVKTMRTGMLSKLWSIITLPYRLNAKLKQRQEYLYTYMLEKTETMEESTLLQSLDYINDYENKKVSPVLYMDYIARVTGVAICKQCGATNNRLHNDFQRRILNTLKLNFPHLVRPIKLKSGRYGSDHFNMTVPFYTYHHLNQLLVKMKGDYKSYYSRGLFEASLQIESDITVLSTYIDDRKSSSIQCVAPKVDEVAVLTPDKEEVIEVPAKVEPKPPVPKKEAPKTKKPTRKRKSAKRK